MYPAVFPEVNHGSPRNSTRGRWGMSQPAGAGLPHAFERVNEWREAWWRHGGLVLLLDFDGTLAPIVSRPEDAALPPETRAALDGLRECAGVEVAVVSGRGLADAREKVGIEEIAYAGNHGMEIEGPGIHRIHEGAAAARPALERVARRVQEAIDGVQGAFVEDKGLTLSVHFRMAEAEAVPRVREAVNAAAKEEEGLRVTAGKMVLEVRPRVDWHKGRAVEFLLDTLAPHEGTPVLYLGDDTTDEDAFRALSNREGILGEGVRIGRPEEATAARSVLESPMEVPEFLRRLAEGPET
jgi:trehalose 6-phosphate phosphatase